MANEINALSQGAFNGRSAFVEHLRAAFAAAAHQGWQQLVLSDLDFSDWPLGEEAVIHALQAWSASGRSLHLIARDFELFGRHHARFVRWRRMWDHIVQARAYAGPRAAEIPSAFWTPTWFLHRIDAERCRGVCGSEAEARVALRHRMGEIFQQGQPAFAASVLGL